MRRIFHRAINAGIMPSVEVTKVGRGSSKSGDPSCDLQVIEICCGSARLTKACIAAGLKAIGVDWSGSKDKPEAQTIWIDLAIEAGFEGLMDLLDDDKNSLVVFFMARCSCSDSSSDSISDGLTAS